MAGPRSILWGGYARYTPQKVHPPAWKIHPLECTPPGVNIKWWPLKRAVRILLECCLVYIGCVRHIVWFFFFEQKKTTKTTKFFSKHHKQNPVRMRVFYSPVKVVIWSNDMLEHVTGL